MCCAKRAWAATLQTLFDIEEFFIPGLVIGAKVQASTY